MLAVMVVLSTEVVVLSLAAVVLSTVEVVLSTDVVVLSTVSALSTVDALFSVGVGAGSFEVEAVFVAELSVVVFWT